MTTDDVRPGDAAVRVLDEPIALDDYGDQWCPLCRATRQRNSTLPFGHAPDCPWAVARALAGEEG